MMIRLSQTAANSGAAAFDGTLLAVVLVASAALALATVIDVIRRPARLALGGRRWPWLLIVLFLVGLGWALYLLFGRLSEEDLLEQEEFARSDPS